MADSTPTDPASQTESPTDPSNPNTTVPAQWQPFIEHPPPIPAPFSDLLSQYSNIPAETQTSHILQVRDRAFATVPYPCLGRFRFLQLDLSKHPLYKSHVLPTLTSPSTTFTPPHDPIFLDVGSCLGQDLRKLVFDGVPVSRVYGADMRWAIIEPGYELFRDEEKFPRDKFLVPGNMLDDSEASALSVMHGICDVVNLVAVFHLFDLPEQVVVASRAVSLLRRDPGAKKLVLGQHLAKHTGVVEETPRGKRFRHDEKTWRELWDGVLQGEKWRDVVKTWEVGGIMRDINQGLFTDHRWHLWWTWIEFR